MTSKAIKVVIVNYSSSDQLAECLRSLDGEVDSVLVFDNGSPGDEWTSLLALKSRYPWVRIERSNENLGFGAGVNAAANLVELTAGDLLWIVNPDTVAARGAADLLAATLIHGRADIVSPLISSGSGDNLRIWFAGGVVDTSSGQSLHWHIDEPLSKAPQLEFETEFVTGAAPMITNEAWRRLGGMREDLFLYWEDADLSLRAATLGLVSVVVPDALVWHMEGGSSHGHNSGRSPNFYYYLQRNRLIVCSANTTRMQLALGRGLLVTASLFLRPLFREPRPRWQRFLASASGFRDGWRGRTGIRP